MGGMILAQAGRAVHQAAKSAAFVHYFGLERRCAELLSILLDAQGDALTAQQLATLCNATAGSLKQRIHHLRKAMEAEAIDHGERGYWLTDIGLAEARAAMMVMTRELRAA